MPLVRLLLVLPAFAALAFSATFGTVVAGSGGASYTDILFDQQRQKLYLVDNTANRIDVYSLGQKTFLPAIPTDAQPVSMAFSPDGNTLYVVAYSDSALDIIDLRPAALGVTSRVSLPASPEGVAVGGDGRVLISTIGSGGQNILLLYDPSANSGQGSSGQGLASIPVAPAAPTPPTLPAPVNTPFLSYHSKLLTTKDGAYIIGTNITSTSTTAGRVVFVYEVSSATVLRSRIVAGLSNVLAIAPDGASFMAGSTLFDTQTLSILAQENVANSPFAFPAGVNFNTQSATATAQAVQGGAIWTPDGASLWAAFNYAPVTNPASASNISRLMQNDPSNLLIKLGLEMPENLSGRMVMTPAGDTIYALSQSGFMILPLSAISQGPLAIADSQVNLVLNDQCGVTAGQKSSTTNLTNSGRGRISLSVQTYTVANTGVASVGATGGAGGTFVTNPGGIIVGFGGAFGPGGNPVTISLPGTGTGVTTASAGVTPLVQTKTTSTGGQLVFQYNPSAATNLGTSTPSDFLVQVPEAINIPANVRVFQNNRNAESSGKILLTQQNISSAETLMDMVMDSARQRVYVANSGMNQVEIVDMKTQTLMTPVKVGQLPHSLAMSADGSTMYVANTGGESISIVDLDKMQTVGRVAFPAIPANVSVALAYPVAIATTERGPQFVMSNGTLWKIDGTTAVPRTLNPTIFGTTNGNAVTTVSGGNPSQYSLAATPAGEYAVLVTGAGNAYLYDASVDDYTVFKSVFTTPLTGYIGPIAAGPKGAYYVANGTILNSALTKVASNVLSTSTRTTSAVASVSASTVAMFTNPARTSTSATATVSDAGQVSLVDVTSGLATRTVAALEGPLSTVVGTNARATIPGRTLAIDSQGGYAYALTTSGISILPMPAPASGGGPGGLPGPLPAVSSGTPRVNSNGVVNMASYLAAVAPGSLISIFGSGLGASATPSTASLPTVLGGTCVTLNNVAVPLILTSDAQINAQIPVTLAAGRYPLVVRSISNLVASSSSTVAVTKYAPAIFVSGSQAAIFHDDGTYVTPDNPATRDQSLVMYGTGFGVTHGANVTTGNPVPASPAATTDPLLVYFGDPSYSQSAIIVNSSVLVPGMIGINQINVTVPGTHMKGDALPVKVKIGGVSSPSTGAAIPTISVQ